MSSKDWKVYIKEAREICKVSALYTYLDLSERFAAVKHVARLLLKLRTEDAYDKEKKRT